MRRHPLAPAAAIGVSLLLLQSLSRADSLNGYHDANGFAERVHSVRVIPHRGYLELTVTRTVENLRKTTDEASIAFDIPERAVAVRLRSQGFNAGRPVWFEGELLDAAVAIDRYRFLTGLGQAQAKDPAWLYWTSPNSLGLQVFPCAPGQPKTVEYQLYLPMTYADGRYTAELPPIGSESFRATLEVAAGGAHDRILINQHELFPGSRVRAPTDGTSTHVAYAPEQTALVQGELAQVNLGPDRHYLRAELRAKAKLSTIPTDARLIFLFDLSRSVGDSWEPQQHLFETVASLFPNAKIAAWGYDRTLRPITNGLVSFEQARAAVFALPTATRNGSRADLALQAATELIATNKLSREKTRVFLLTDAQVATSFGDSRIESAIRSLSATVHLAQVTEGYCSLDHDTDLPWNHAVESTSGTSWLASASADTTECSPVMEELARPKRLFVNALSLEGSGTDISVPETLDEGQSFVHESVTTGSARNLGLKAKLWGKVVAFEFAPDREMSRIRSALATANPDLDLSDTELKALAYRGRAVTRLTSYLAIEPGVRPSSEGIERSEGGSGSLGIGLSAISSGSRANVALPFRHQAYLEEMVDRARIDCGVSFLRASVTIETNYSEIVDVIRAQILDAPPSASGCLTERLWALELPSNFNQTRATYTVYR